MRRQFVFTVTFKVIIALSKDLQEYLEEIHIPELHETGCFMGRIRKQLDKNSLQGFHTITYSHKVKDGEEGWRRYNEQFRAPLRADFEKHYLEYINSGKLFVTPTVSWVESLKVQVSNVRA